MFDVTTKGVSGSVVSVTAESEGEMLDRVRIAMQSEYVSEVSVSKSISHLLRPVHQDSRPAKVEQQDGRVVEFWR